MIEATCSACGTLNRIAEADVPMGAKFVNCTSCKSRVALPAKAGAPVLPKLPPPVPKGPPAVALGPPGAAPSDIIDLADLPAPRRGSPLEVSDLPAPRSSRAAAPLNLDEMLPSADGVSDLPAPRSSRPQPQAPAQADGVSDLPAPRSSRPQPQAPAQADGVSDLPAPRSSRAAAPSTAPRTVPASNAPVVDLPTPRAGGGRSSADLPAPKTPTAARSGLPADLPIPKSAGAPDLPAPKGFFDDLPQPSRGGGRGGEQPEVPAPKGFFDDIPQPARGTKGGPQAPQNDIAPKGFFDDIPQPARGTKGGPKAPGAEPPAPKGFFDDLPQPARTREQGVAPKGGGFGSGAIDLGEDPIEPFDLAPEAPGLDLAAPPGASFDELDLSAPSTPQSRVGAEEAEKAGIKFSAKKPGAPSAPAMDVKASLPSFANPGAAGAGGALELEEPREKGQVPGGTQRLGPKAKEPPTVNEALLARQRKRKRRIVAGFALGVALLGGGGFFMYQRHAAQQARADAISESITTARKAMAADDAAHWQRAAVAANKVLELDPAHAEAFGIAAEASIAGALADGKNAAGRIAKGHKLIADALAAGVTGPALERAQALSTLTATPDKAPARFEALLAKAPKDGVLALYLAWSHAANGNSPDALKAYDRAIETPSVKVQALLGRARLKLLGNDVDGARKDFTAILDVDKDNIPAQVGLAATLPVGQAQQKESDLLAILARKDIANGDPRAIVQAWVLAADLARKSGRLDAARERYRKAIALDAKDISGMTGLAEVEIREKKVANAEELISKVLTQAPNDANAQLVQSEISILKGDIPDAEKRIRILAERQPPLPPLDQARLLLVKGKLHELRKEDEDAIAAYTAGAKLAGDRDLTATFAAVAKLTAMANDASAVKNITKEAALRGRAEQLLVALAEMAHGDPNLALTLGNAYLQSGAPAKAEPWLRRVIAARPTDADALYQLGKVLRRLGKGDEAIELLKKAREIEPNRAEIGMELARTFELTRRDADAGAIYAKLLEGAEPSLELRGHAGKFFVRTGKLEEAGKQGEKILELDKLSSTGHYLYGEGLLAAGQIDSARKEFTAAVDQERDARYLDGLGRASESLSIQRGRDLSMQDAALRAYQAAAELDPTLFSPMLGQGRLYVARREMSKAVNTLVAADKLQANDPDVAFLLGAAYKELGTAEYKRNAVKWLQKANQLREGAETSYLLGQLYQDEALKEVRPAIESYKIATRRAEEEIKKTGQKPAWYAEALYQLGDLANQLGEEVTACKAWRKYLGEPGTKNRARVAEINRVLATGLQGVCQ